MKKYKIIKRSSGIYWKVQRLLSLPPKDKKLENFVKRVFEMQPIIYQIRSEILSLVKQIKKLSPKRVLEIGGRPGGALAIFAQASAKNAKILSLDIKYSPARMKVLSSLAKPQQNIKCMRADSHSQATKKKNLKWLGQEKLDFLFIDGDHTFEGVAKDYKMYAPLVRKDGIIAFHDIVPDNKTRYGKKTDHYTGGVPLFWAKLKKEHLKAIEFIEDTDQDGFGIGLIRKK